MVKVIFLAGLVFICCPCALIGGLIPLASTREVSLDPPPVQVVDQPPSQPDDLKRPIDDDEDLPPTGRPELSGPVETLDTPHFRIHFTRSSDDAVPLEDSNADNLPDYVENVGKSLEHVRQVQVDRLGWAAPPPDGGLGGDDRYDVYLENIFEDGTAGYTDGGWPETIIGDNPNSPTTETRASHSFLAIDNDFAEMTEEEQELYTPTNFMFSTVAHEFNHAIQFGYDGEEPAGWLWEATASWMQDEVYDDINDGNDDLWAVFKAPDTCQLAYGGEERLEDENHWYGMWVFLRHISEQHGQAAVRTIWEHARTLDDYSALEAALADVNATLEGTFTTFAVALLTRNFEEGTDYPTVRLEGVVENTFTPMDGVGQMAVDYVEIFAGAPVRITLESEDLTGLLVGLANGQANLFPMTQGQVDVDASQFDRLYLLALNLNRAADEYDCEMTPYTVRVEPARDVQAPQQIIDTPNFEPPQEEPLLNPDDYYAGEGDWPEGEPVEPPPKLLLPSLPFGYSLDGAYRLERSAFEMEEEELAWVIPGDGPAIEVYYVGRGDNFISLLASPSPFDTLAEWHEVVEFEPNPEEEFILQDDPVIILDLSEDGEPYASAIFIVDGQFITIDATVSVDQMAGLVTDFLERD